jgi:uncharacterized protein (TIGR01244 family)
MMTSNWRLNMLIRRSLTTSAFLVGLVAAPLLAQQVTKQTVPGVTNFARVETTIACGGATTPEAMPELKKMGFKSVINLRQATEAGANIAEAEAAAKAADLIYVHIPFNAASPDPAVADRFLAEITKPANTPAYVHCASANRAAAMWMIKRLSVDHWDVEKASTEAAGLGLTNPALKEFAINYAQTHKQ